MYDESFNNSLAVHISSEHEARKKKRRTIWPSDELEDVQKERHCDMIHPQETMHLNNRQHEAQLPMDSRAAVGMYTHTQTKTMSSSCGR